MSQDSHSGYNPDPEKPYDVPSTYETPSQPPYDLPSTYETPSQPFYEAPPSQYPYQVPPQPPYGAEQQFPYGTPGYDPNHYGYQATSPLPLGEAIRQLPNQYSKILSKPSPATFVVEMGKASWDILWIQLIGYAIIASVLSYLLTLMPGALNAYKASNNTASLPTGMLQAITLGTSLSTIIVIPISFFIGQGIIYLLAKAFGGTGTFLRQGYTYLLILVPIGIISSLLLFIPTVGSLTAFGVGIYNIVLQIFSIMAVHRLSGGKATAVILIPIIIAVVLGIMLVLAVAPNLQ